MSLNLKNITDSDTLNKALQEQIFPDTGFDKEINLAEKWNLETENGESYVLNNGLFIVCQSLKAFREKQLSTCLFAHRDMRCDVLGIPMVPGWQIALFDQCCKHESCDDEVIKLCVYNNVLTRDCYDYIYYAPKEEQKITPTPHKPEIDSIGEDKDKDNAAKPPAKRRKKT